MSASDILIEPLDKKLRVRYRIDGVLREIQAPPKQLQEGIVSRIKIMSDLNVAERRIPQDGRFRMRIGKQHIDLRVSILPAILGEKIVLRILDKNSVSLDIEKLGYDPETIRRLKEGASHPHGMILTTGPTGSRSEEHTSELQSQR